jgi:hypothetical protein
MEEVFLWRLMTDRCLKRYVTPAFLSKQEEYPAPVFAG